MKNAVAAYPSSLSEHIVTIAILGVAELVFPKLQGNFLFSAKAIRNRKWLKAKVENRRQGANIYRIDISAMQCRTLFSK
jgi:hypothetical protein